MKRLVKISSVAALALALATCGTMQARAGGWAVAGGVYYSYPAPVYPAPTYYAPAPAAGYAPAPVVSYAPAAGATVVAVAPAPAYYYAPRVVYTGAYPYGYGYPYVRVGFGWGPRHCYGGRYWHRR
jgi:hypothetical protein